MLEKSVIFCFRSIYLHIFDKFRSLRKVKFETLKTQQKISLISDFINFIKKNNLKIHESDKIIYNNLPNLAIWPNYNLFCKNAPTFQVQINIIRPYGQIR
jgi:hypothetical protein